MSGYVLGLEEVDRTQVALVGGKGAHLGELSRIEGVCVPAGFCVTTSAYDMVAKNAPAMSHLLERVSHLTPEDRDASRELSAEIRSTLQAIIIPDDLVAAIARALDQLGAQRAYAVRSSSTAEDSPTASFAGQQDTYLNVVGLEAILQRITRCWASLFTERAVTYRLRNRMDVRTTRMAVVVQQMVFPQAAGVLFTADPLTGNRKIASVEANFGLGEAFVSGRVNPDVFRIRDDEIVARTIATKRLAIYASPSGGTHEQEIAPEQQEQPALTDSQVLRLARLGQRIESHFGHPQDIEWCLVEDEFQIVQSRPITTLFPIPPANDSENHVYISVGHQQMMTDPMKPLGLSFWQMTTPRPMSEAGGRLFVDVSRILASRASRAPFLKMVGRSDPLIGDALQTILDRGDFIRPRPDDDQGAQPLGGAARPIDTDPRIVAELIRNSETSISALKRDIRTKSGSALLDFIRTDIKELRRILFDPTSHQAIMAGMEAAWWLDHKLEAWLSEKNAAGTLTQSVSGNVTSEMGLALLDVADVIRTHREAVAFLERVVDDENFLEELPRFPGGREARDAIQRWLDSYGMRGAGEIDITRPRWSECPTMLLPILLSHIRSSERGAAKQRFEQGLEAARKKEQEVLQRLRELPDGAQKAEETKHMIDRVRAFAGYREYPKYGMINRYFVYKTALLEEAERLVRMGVLRAKEDLFWLRFEELEELVRTNHVDERLLRERKDAFAWYRSLTPPRVLTSEGEAVAGAYRRHDLPAGALVGLPVSAGTIEGRARIIMDMSDADLETGDILITAFTDPSWTPLFVAIKGLVTEVGGLMTHGAVIAREYGLPAVVGVEHATRLIRDGQRIRVNGTDGFVEILS